MRYKLLVKNFPHEASHMPTEWVMDGGEVLIGRGEFCQIYLPDPRRLVSTNHATIRVSAGQCVLVDTSANGTKLNDQILERGEEYPLQEHDVVNCCDFVMEFIPLPVESVEKFEEEDTKTVLLGSHSLKSYELATDTLRLLYKDIRHRSADERREMLMTALRSQTQGMSLTEADFFLRYVELAFPEPEMQCAQVLQDSEGESHTYLPKGLTDCSSGLSQSGSLNNNVVSFYSGDTTHSSLNLTSRQQEVLTHLFEFLVTFEKGRQQFQKEFFGKDLTRYMGGARNQIKWAIKPVEVERYLFTSGDDETFSQRLKELDEVLLAFHRHPLGIMQGFYKSMNVLLDQFSPTLILQELKETKNIWVSLFKAQTAWQKVQDKYWALNEERQGLVRKFLSPYMEEGYREIVQKIDR